MRYVFLIASSGASTPDHASSSCILLTSNSSPLELYSCLRDFASVLPTFPSWARFDHADPWKESAFFLFFRVLFFFAHLVTETDVLCEGVCFRFFTSESSSLWLSLRYFCFVYHFISWLSRLIDLGRDCDSSPSFICDLTGDQPTSLAKVPPWIICDLTEDQEISPRLLYFVFDLTDLNWLCLPYLILDELRFCAGFAPECFPASHLVRPDLAGWTLLNQTISHIWLPQNPFVPYGVAAFYLSDNANN